MSEYQYYEFVAIDGPISDEGMRYARGCSTRAEVSRFWWRNVYHFGSFHGKEETLLGHYDAHFYVANWGTARLGLAFPEGSLPLESIRPYLGQGTRDDHTLTLQKIGKRFILWWELNEEGGWGWTGGQGILDQLIGVREELLRGDYRALFLGWLADFEPEDWTGSKGGAAVVPPIPGELDHLSPAQKALIEQFPVDRDALAVAAGLSQTTTAERIPIASVLDKLSVSEMRAWLERVAGGEGSKVMSELNRLTCAPPTGAASAALSRKDFAAQILEARKARRQKEAEAEAAKRRQDAEERRQRLIVVRERADKIWAGLDPLMDQKIAAAYDQAAAQLQELRDAYEQAGESARFQQQLSAFRERYTHRPAMIRRLKEL